MVESSWVQRKTCTATKTTPVTQATTLRAKVQVSGSPVQGPGEESTSFWARCPFISSEEKLIAWARTKMKRTRGQHKLCPCGRRGPVLFVDLDCNYHHFDCTFAPGRQRVCREQSFHLLLACLPKGLPERSAWTQRQRAWMWMKLSLWNLLTLPPWLCSHLLLQKCILCVQKQYVRFSWNPFKFIHCVVQISSSLISFIFIAHLFSERENS